MSLFVATRALVRGVGNALLPYGHSRARGGKHGNPVRPRRIAVGQCAHAEHLGYVTVVLMKIRLGIKLPRRCGIAFLFFFVTMSFLFFCILCCFLRGKRQGRNPYLSSHIPKVYINNHLVIVITPDLIHYPI